MTYIFFCAQLATFYPQLLTIAILWKNETMYKSQVFSHRPLNHFKTQLIFYQELLLKNIYIDLINIENKLFGLYLTNLHN